MPLSRVLEDVVMRVEMFKMFMNRAKYESTKKSEKEKKPFFSLRFFWVFFFFKENCVGWAGEEAKHFGDGPT